MGPNVKKWLLAQSLAIAIVFVTGLIIVSLQSEQFNAKNCFQRVVTSLSENWFGQNCRGGIDWKFHRVDELTMEQIITYVEWANSSSCRLSHDFGGNVIFTAGVDGQKAVCLDPAVRPERASGAWPPVTKKKFNECLVYSFGIKNEWSFDEAMEALGCRVYAFDPSMNRTRHDHTSKIHFYDLGLSDRDEQRVDDQEKNWTMKSLDSIYHNLLGHQGKIIDYLKIDIERDEWIVLPQILSSGMMDRVRQMGVEIHLLSPTGNNTLDEIRQNIKTLKSLEDYGLVRFDSKFNPWSNDLKIIDNVEWWGYDAYELVWYNSKLARKGHEM
ncbi:hypothetical protein GHT06_010037 [Daphnia sinensis]|uniref:Methyltransferase domain-containing protein n=1 Tax=Daphnia sinensis TaxID=1820382 RepID=A0AAD5L0C0_9CRUS|nr:hypothetical protein GHT06_010037 [Daphnia sinensis]